VDLKAIEESVRQIVANHLFDIVREITHYTRKHLEKYIEDSYNISEKKVEKGITALIADRKVWLDKCRIRDKEIGTIETGFCLETRHGLGGYEYDEHWVRINIKSTEIFFAEWGWDEVKTDSVKFTLTPDAKRAFETLSEKAKEIKGIQYNKKK